MSVNEEYVYIFTNPAMPEYVKIGITNDIERRLKDLSKPTAVAEPFQCYAYLTVKGDKPSARDIEKALHYFLDSKRTKNREFFSVPVSEAEKYFKYIVSINPRVRYSLWKDKDRKKARQTTFELLDIPVDAELVYKPDNSIRCTVVDKKNTVLYDGEETTLSAIAMRHSNKIAINGFECFVYPADAEHPDETLWYRRKRLHPEL